MYPNRDRDEEMLQSAGIYRTDGRSGPVIATPLPWAQFAGKLEDSGKRGAEGRFCWFKGDGKFAGVKEFLWSSDYTLDDKRDRANVIARAMTTLESLDLHSGKLIVLLNRLNVPKRFAVDADGALKGIVVPHIPDSCYKPVRTGGSVPILLGDVISAGGRIDSRTGNFNDPLPEVAKWSLLASLCESISSLHVLGLSHGDISSTNVYVRWPESDDPKAYVIDAFNGLSSNGKNVSGQRLRASRMFTDAYCPYSVRDALYTEASDVYALAYWVTHLTLGRTLLPRSSFANLKDTTGMKQAFWWRDVYVRRTLQQKGRDLPAWLYNVLCAAIFEKPERRPSSRELTYAVHDHWLNLRIG